MRGLVGVVLAVGLLMGCGGSEADAESQAPQAQPGQVQQASACSDACDAKLDSCLSGGGVLWRICFDRHTACVNSCGDIE